MGFVKWRHLDLFSGQAGNAVAAERVWGDQYENVGFCEIEPFPQAIIRKHYPDAKVFPDIKTLDGTKLSADLITGGFPCQPFSSAGKREGKNDDRHLWPEMLRVIREVSPRWVVGENVRGLTNWNGGLVFNEVQSDLEAAGYEVLPFLLPAAGVNAPHERYRIWIVAHAKGDGGGRRAEQVPGAERGQELDHLAEPVLADRVRASAHSGGAGRQQESGSPSRHEGKDERRSAKENNLLAGAREVRGRKHAASDTGSLRSAPGRKILGSDRRFKNGSPARQWSEAGNGLADIREESLWQENWLEVVSRLCRVDDGLPDWLDRMERTSIYKAIKYFGREEAERALGVDLSKADPFRKDRLKANGNAIVWWLEAQIFKAIRIYEESLI